MRTRIDKVFGHPREKIITFSRDAVTVWSQQEVGYLLGVSRQAICYWTNEQVSEKQREKQRENSKKPETKAKRRAVGRAYWQKPEVRAKHNARRRDRYRQQPEFKAKARERIRSPKYRANRNKRLSERRANDPFFRAERCIRNRFRKAIKGGPKAGSAIRHLLGCTVAELFAYFEADGMMRDGMTRDNYGKDWHLDHVRPLASFDMQDVEQQKIAWHFTNLQPLLGPENSSKGSWWDGSYWRGGKRT